MSHIMMPFEVASHALPQPAKVRFVQIYSAIATRHSDTIDCVFRVNGEKAVVATSCATLTQLHEAEGKSFTDQQLVNIAARLLRRTLEAGYDATEAELPLRGEEFCRLAKELGYL
jgi:hypothetical protein